MQEDRQLRRQKKITALAYCYISLTQQHSKGSLKFNFLASNPACTDKAVCERSKCDFCLPHLCPNAFLKVVNQVKLYLDGKIDNCGDEKFTFETDFKIKRHNPAVICMNRLGFPINYIKNWLHGCDVKLRVLTNLEFYGPVHDRGSAWETYWKPLTLENEEQEDLIKLAGRNMVPLLSKHQSKGHITNVKIYP